MSELRKISIQFCILLALFAFRCGMEEEPIVEHEEEEEVIEKVVCEEEEREYIALIFQDLVSPRFCKIINIDPEYDINNRQIDVIIDNQADYEYYIHCTDGLQEIDFEEYFLVAGRYFHYHGAELSKREIYFCKKHIVIDIIILEAARTSLTFVYYYFILKRVYSEFPIQIDVDMILLEDQ